MINSIITYKDGKINSLLAIIGKWQGVCVAGGHTGGHAWRGGMHGRGDTCGRGACIGGGMHATPPRHYEIQSVNARTVRILLESILFRRKIEIPFISRSRTANIVNKQWRIQDFRESGASTPYRGTPNYFYRLQQ